MSSLEPAFHVDDTPSNAQLALAVAVVKLKPSNATIREYILEVRDHIQKGRREQDGHGSSNYLDSVAFWQQAYEKSELAQSQLLDKIYELERRNDALMDRTRSNGMEAVPPSPKSSLKRKTKVQSGGSMIENSRKRTKGAAMGNSGNAGTGAKESLQDIVSGFDYLEEDMAPFLRQLYWLQRLLQKKLNIRSVSLTAVELCKSGEAALNSALEPKQKPTNSRASQKTRLKSAEPDAISILHAIERSYPCLLHSLKKVSTADDGRSHAGLILYHIILLFETILNGLRRHSIATAKESIARAKQPKKEKGRGKTNRTKTAQVTTAQEEKGEEDTIPRQLAHLLQAMILSLNLTIREQCNLLEGFLFLLLDRVGKILCFFVLGDLRLNRHLRLDPSELPLPGGLAEMQDGEITRKGAEREAKYLIKILEKTLAFVDHNKERMAAMPIFNSPIGDKQTAHSVPSITERVRTKLQNTLLKAVFGDQDACFKDCLPSPEVPDPAPEPAEQDRASPETEDTPEWFTREIWRLLGWDILARE